MNLVPCCRYIFLFDRLMLLCKITRVNSLIYVILTSSKSFVVVELPCLMHSHDCSVKMFKCHCSMQYIKANWHHICQVIVLLIKCVHHDIGL